MKKKLKPRVPPEDLSYDDDGFYLRAATVCVRDETESQVLLVSSPRWGPDCWLVPGGKVQKGESCERGAAREALEEAGVSGRVGRCLGSFDNVSRRHRTWVYVLHVDALLEEYDDANIRRRSWFHVDEAKRMLVGRHATQCQYVSALENQQQQQQQQMSSPVEQAVKR